MGRQGKQAHQGGQKCGKKGTQSTLLLSNHPRQSDETRLIWGNEGEIRKPWSIGDMALSHLYPLTSHLNMRITTLLVNR